jgi:ubiquinone biosynthesis protein
MLWAYSAPPLFRETSIFGVVGCVSACVLGFHLFRAIQHSGRLEERE